jgi:hypothetical protein
MHTVLYCDSHTRKRHAASPIQQQGIILWHCWQVLLCCTTVCAALGLALSPTHSWWHPACKSHQLAVRCLHTTWHNAPADHKRLLAAKGHTPMQCFNIRTRFTGYNQTSAAVACLSACQPGGSSSTATNPGCCPQEQRQHNTVS